MLQTYKINHQTVFHGVDLEKQFERLFALENYSRENDLLYRRASAILFEMLMLCAEKSNEDNSVSYYAGQLRTLLDNAVTKHESLDSMCKRLYISKSFAIKEFKKYFKATPHGYLLNKRLVNYNMNLELCAILFVLSLPFFHTKMHLQICLTFGVHFTSPGLYEKITFYFYKNGSPTKKPFSV